MRLKTQWREVRFGGAVGAALTTFLGCVFLIYGVGDGLTHLSYDLPFVLKRATTPTNAVIVYMDEESHKQLGEQPYNAYWDRRIHAQLLERLKAASVKAVAFDVLFDVTTPHDAALVEAVKAHGRVAVAVRSTATVLSGGIVHLSTIEPFEELRQAAACGVVESTGGDGVVREHYRVRHSTNLMSLAWKTAELAGVKDLPPPFARRYLNYYGPAGTIPWRSYYQVLSNEVPVEVLSNKVVFVGARVETGYSGTKGSDFFPTPYTRRTGAKAAGVEINTTAFLNLARGDWLTRMSPGSELLLVAAVGLVLGIGLMLFRPVAVSLLAVLSMLAVFAVACWLAWSERIWFAWAIVSAVQIPCAAVCAIVYRTQRVFGEKQALEEALARPGGSLAGGTVALANPAPLARGVQSEVIRQQLQAHEGPTRTGGFGEALPGPARVGPPLIPDCTLLRRIGAGAYGEVWIGSNVIGAFRAIKVVHRANFQEDRPYEREFEGIRHFDPVSRQHPGLVHVLHVGRNDQAGYFYYVMELADDASGTQPFCPDLYQARSLSSDLEGRQRLEVKTCLELGLALADALDYLHSHNLIHRDIKPANIIFVGGKPKLADIGLITQIGIGRTFVGTEGFYPPEGPGSPSADVYSLGKVLYVALTGLPAGQFPDLPPDLADAQVSGVWQALNQVVLRACERNVHQRYSTARELHAALATVGADAEPGWRLFGKKAAVRRVL